MSGRRWIFTLLAAVPISATGCQVDGGARTMWNPFVRADKSDAMGDEQLPKFVRRVTEGENEESKRMEVPIAASRVQALIAEGQRALQDNRIPDAKLAYNEVLQFIPDDPTAHHGLAMAADLTEQWAEAEDHYRQALRSRPRDANLLCDIGYSYLLQNRYSEASSYLSQAIEINPNHENAHTNLALLDVRQGNREAARERLTRRFENAAMVNQILAALESQTASRTATSPAATAPVVPENASFQEIRELANRERIAAEKRRVVLNVPVVQNAVVSPVIAASDSSNLGHYDNSDPLGTRQQSNRFAGSNVDPATAGFQPTGNYPSGNIASNTVVQTPSIVPAQFGGTPGTSSRTNPLAGNPNFAPAYANTGTTAGSLNPPFSANSGTPSNNQQPVAASNFSPQVANAAASSGGVIAVRPSGSFQPPTQGVSYGQPFGFGQPPIETASFQNNGNVAVPVGNTSYGNAAYGNMPGGPPVAHMPSQQKPNAGQNNSHVQLDGLNAGPGSLFPIGQGSDAQDGQLRMGNVSSPGSNSVINGAMYGQPVSTLPSQEWMMQQQGQIHQLHSQQPQPNQNGQGYSGQGYSNQGGANPQYTGNIPQGSSYGNTGSTTALRSDNQTQPVNPLATYENQLRQLDNQYNNSLQQLDRNASGAVPRAQY